MAYSMMGGYGGYGMMGGYGWGFGMWVFPLLILALFFAVVWWLVKQNQGYSSGDTAEQILKKRLARGEITEKEYRKIKKEID